MNDYIQKYGDKALQIYQKSLRNSQTLYPPSPNKQSHLLPKKSISKKLLKSNSCLKNSSQSRLNHSKSTKHTKYVQTIQLTQNNKRKSSFVQNKKNNFTSTSSNGFYHTFSKVNNGNKKKLIISQVTTPKCSTPLRLQQELKLQKQIRNQKNTIRNQKSTIKNEKDTERNSKSNKKSAKKRKHVQEMLQETLTDKKTIKSLVKGVTQCLQIIFSEDQKMRKMFYLLKETIQKISNLAEKYKNRLKRAQSKIQQLYQIQQIYLEKKSIGKNSKISISKFNSQEEIKKRKGIQVIILNENYDLRKKISKLQKQIDYYTSKQASLMNVFGKFKNSDSQLKHSKFQQNLSEDKNLFKYQFLNNNATNFHSLNPNRRSSQNLNNKISAYCTEKIQQKRLSFDGYEGNVMSQREKNRVDLNENVEQLSEQESSQNE